MTFTLSLRQAALGLLLLNSVATAQFSNGHNGELVQRESAEDKRGLFDYVDDIVKRVNAVAASGTAVAATETVPAPPPPSGTPPAPPAPPANGTAAAPPPPAATDAAAPPPPPAA
ncbi:hypothetical protein G7054_g14995 [Neopestalotiopsis clavispora]|nr:hypothetical protein G7054_g14995 [Neopestalotiopsis clavispora]